MKGFSWTLILLIFSLSSCSTSENEVPVPVEGKLDEVLQEEPVAEEEIIPSLIANATAPEIATNETENATNTVALKVNCLISENDTDISPAVEVVNSTKLLTLMQIRQNITSQQIPATCLIAYFFSPSCPFSCMAAPHFNALPRVFPMLKVVAVDTSARHNLNTQYAIIGVPSLLLFHNGRTVARFNSSSEYTLDYFAKFVNQNTGTHNYKLENFAGFITKHTGIQPEGELVVTSEDFSGPISSVPETHIDYYLILSWLFLILCTSYYFYQSTWYKYIIDGVRNAWREAEDQHAHSD